MMKIKKFLKRFLIFVLRTFKFCEQNKRIKWGSKKKIWAMRKSCADSLVQIEFTIRTNALEPWPRGLS
jgi:hypothetical protein